MNEDQKMTNTENAELFEAKMRFAETEKELIWLKEERDRSFREIERLLWRPIDDQVSEQILWQIVDQTNQQIRK